MRKIFLFLAIFVVCFQLVSATDTNIHVKTVPYMNVNVLVVSSSLVQYDRFNANADRYGDVSFVFSSDKTDFGLGIYVKDNQDNSKVVSESLKGLKAGEDISVVVVPEGFKVIETPGENISNVSAETSMPESNISNESLLAASEPSADQSGIQGLAVSSGNSNFKNIAIYVVGAIVLILIIFFIVRKTRKGKSEIKVKKFSDWKEEQKDATPGQYYGVLEETQKKLEDTQRELNSIKNQSRIKETEEKLRRDAQELRSLRGF
jgi:hypothetical protein